MPDWYPLIKASRVLGVAPWELAKQPVCWMEWALISERAESKAEGIAGQIREQRSKLNGG